MPPLIIPTAQRPDTYIQPSEIGINALEAAAGTAQRAGNTQRELYNEAGRGAQKIFAGLADDLQKRDAKQSEQEITKAGNALTEIQLNQIKEHGDTGSYPSADDQIQSYRNTLIDQGATDKTLKWFDQESNRIRLHTATVQASERVKNAGETSTTDLTKFVNGQAAIANQDPSALDHVLDRIDSTVPAGFGGLQEGHKAELTQKAKGAVIEQAVKGYTDKGDFENARRLLSDPKYAPFIGEHSAAFASYVEQKEKAQGAQARADQTFQESQDKKNASASLANLTAQTIHVGPDGKPDGTIYVPPNYYSDLLGLARMPGADHTMIDAAIKDAQAIEKRTRDGVVATTDPQIYNQFQSRMFSGLTDQDIFQAHAAGKLSDHDFTMFREAVASAAKNPQAKQDEKLFNDFVKFNGEQIKKSSAIAPQGNPYAGQRIFEFTQDKRTQFQQGLAAGKTPAALLTPGSADYIGNDLNKYQLTPQQEREGLMSQGRGQLSPLPPVRHDLPQRNPGESPADYLKRTGQQ